MVNRRQSKARSARQEFNNKHDEDQSMSKRGSDSKSTYASYQSNFRVFLNAKSDMRHLSSPDPGRCSQSNALIKSSRMRTSKPKFQPNRPTIPPELSFLAFQDSMCRTFLVEKWKCALAGRFVNILETPSAPQKPVDALARRYFGECHGQIVVSQSGIRLYVEALSDMAKSLKAETNLDWVSMTITIAVLFLCEGFSHSDLETPLIHGDGLSRFIESRGQTKCHSPENLKIFETVRPIMVNSALRRRKRTFLEKAEWLEIPWSASSGEKSLAVQLDDIQCKVPGILSDIDSIVEDSTNRNPPVDEEHSGSKISQLLSRIYELLKILREWGVRWLKANPLAVFTSDLECRLQEFPARLYGRPLDFLAPTLCEQFLFYHLTIYTLSTAAQQWPLDTIVGSFSQLEINSDALDPSQPRKSAYLVCRCVPYLLDSPQRGDNSSKIAHHALEIVHKYFTSQSKERMWIENLFQKLTQKDLLGGRKDI